MPRSQFIDFKALKQAITIEQVLAHYGFIDQFKRNGDTLSGPCPIHNGTNPTQFRVSVSKNVWNCFSTCKGGGNVLDFIARKEDVTIHAAAVKAIEWFKIDLESPSTKATAGAKSPREAAPGNPAPRAIQPTAADSPEVRNPELKFRLEKLEPEHPYLAERGISPEVAREFGIGYCDKGLMAGRIAIPIRNETGGVVAYAGRFAGTPEDSVPKYKLPAGFKKSLELFNLDRAIRESPGTPLVIVEGFFDCIHLHQLGLRRVVALMGSSMSESQEALIRRRTDSNSQILVMLDEDEAGRNGRDDIALRLAKIAFVKVFAFPTEGQQPEHLSAEDISALL